ncbi:phosphoribosylanthranilate isomerase [Streptomyces sp. NY05-11A]|uniref:phosphoribosylanthranilate isomerase n=1 Tax=Streptomyces soliscabiei TaxID=588897 RepID=UPI0029A8F5B8|nr:N-(5'-phosphoribosyl)anthranilate isomerase [Streptomyces sp. NY05-11A]MDX2680458.1 N-(5'-phosphoribosyl)anthranilate isomerase [Streptomyces sp. NY05-11A]
MLVKICGATTEREVRAVAGAGADLVGLWHGVPGGRADLSAQRLARLAAEARATGRLRSVLVTFGSQTQTLARTAVDSGVDWIQLHGYQRPALVRALRAQLPASVSLVKVLHVRGTSCPEASLIKAYERAGTDLFLLDAATADGRVGSTAHTLDDPTAADLARRTTRPFLLAGGLRPDNRHRFGTVLAHSRFCGIDVDSAARDGTGLLDGARTADLVRAWRTP